MGHSFQRFQVQSYILLHFHDIYIDTQVEDKSHKSSEHLFLGVKYNQQILFFESDNCKKEFSRFYNHIAFLAAELLNQGQRTEFTANKSLTVRL